MMCGHMRYLVYNGCRGGTMKATAEQIGLEYEEELTVCCYDPGRSENRAGQKLLPVNG